MVAMLLSYAVISPYTPRVPLDPMVVLVHVPCLLDLTLLLFLTVRSFVSRLLCPIMTKLKIVIHASYMANTYDFYKPNLSSEYPEVDGPVSVVTYVAALDAAYSVFKEKVAKLSKRAQLAGH